MRRMLTIAAAAALFATPALAASDQEQAQGQAGVIEPPAGYEKVADLVPLPEFVPGMGVLYVQPDSLPAGPFLGYDRDGKLVNTTYMIPVTEFEAKKTLDNLEVGTKAPVDHVDIVFNEGHPGVAEPHWHIVLWHIPAPQEARLAE